MLEWGKFVKLLEKRAAKGKRTPALDSRPDLLADWAWVWIGFNQLHQSRQVGFGPCPLSASEILAWCQIHAVTNPEDRIDFYELILALDAEWLIWARLKLDEQKDQSKNKGKDKRNANA